MKKIIFICFILLINVAVAQIPDTILVKTKRIKGFGPFRLELFPISQINLNSPWIETVPKIKGIPDSLSDLMFDVKQVDFFQFTYQNYYAGKISENIYNSCKDSWNWKPDSTEYTKQLVKVCIAIAAGYDMKGNLLVLVDRNNNYDLSDDKYYKIPPKIPGQNFWERYNDLLPFRIEYEYYNGKRIKKDSSWFYIDYNPMNYKSDMKNIPIQLSYAFPEYHLGEIDFNGEEYMLALKSDEVVLHDFYYVKVWKKDESNQSNPDEAPQPGRLVKLGNYYYKIKKVSAAGNNVILTKDKNVESKGGNEVGLKAIGFSAKTIDGKSITLKKLRGNYVLLNFWGSWCSPCRAEIPNLESLYKKYKNKNFIMVGIANDNIKNLESFLKKNKMDWAQILQDRNKSIINLYGVSGYPTTFLIDPKGEIIFKSSEPLSLDKKLENIFNK